MRTPSTRVPAMNIPQFQHEHGISVGLVTDAIDKL
jgi:hypothetical protein